jgi:acyl-CoA dehydrogenase
VERFIETLHLRGKSVAKCASKSADIVDREARFPTEAIAMARAEQLLGVMVPVDLGGEGASIADVVDLCYVLGRACASTGMIFAMHQIMVAILIRHAYASPWHRQLLSLIASDQLLVASSTTEGQGGGDLRRSEAAIERTGSRITFEKSATVLSYAAQADAILTTARRAADAPPSDQVLLALGKADYLLDPIVDWQTLGMRGTCSCGFTLKAIGSEEQIVPDSYAAIQTHTMMPVAHLTWSAVWSGIAADAVDRARRFVRTAMRRSGGQSPPGAIHLTRAMMSLRVLQAMVGSAVRRFEAAAADKGQLESLDFQNTMNLHKVTASETAVAIVMSCMRACGLAGYRNDGEFSLSRHLRDVLSSPLMINNDRILNSAAAGSVLIEVPDSIVS